MFGDRDMTNFDPDNLVMVIQAQRLFIKTYRPQYKAQRTCRECLDSGRKAKRSYGIAVCQRCGTTFEKLSARGKYCPKCRKKKYRKEKS